ncbi:MAG: pilus assembly protein TadG-related protein [Pseudomonadota bacterium]
MSRSWIEQAAFVKATATAVPAAFARFRRDKSAMAGVIFGIAIMPVLGLTGAAMDYSRAIDIRVQYQSAADAAALAVATSGLSSFDERQDFGRSVFEANAPLYGHNLIRVDLTEQLGEFQVTAVGEVDTTLLELLGVPEISLNVDSTAVAASYPLEISFVIDATNSMLRGSRWRTAYDSLDLMLETLDRSSTDDGDLFVTVVPMGDTVNIGEARFNWAEGFVADDSDTETWGEDHAFNYMELDDWEGCVFARQQPLPGEPYRLTDDRAGEVPFGAMDQDLNNHAYPGRGSRGFGCPAPIIGPTEDVRYVMREVDDIRAAGTGRFDQGMAWGWRAVSANWQSEWGIAGYPTTDLEERKKAIVFISDGNSTMEQWRFDGHQDWGYNNAGREMLGNLVAVCEQAKLQGIEVFTLYVRGNPYAESYMRDCASSPTHFFDVTRNNDMEAAFSSMGARLSHARLVR